jgi:hypothetical protein
MTERPNGPHIGVYCADCGTWQKWRKKNMSEPAFTIDHNNTSGSLIPEGVYEAVIKAAFENTTKNGAMYIDIPLIVRNDIEQPRKNVHIFHKIWKKKEPNEHDRRCGGYIAAQINAISKAAGIPNGKPYASLEELFNDLYHKPVLVSVKHEEYNNQPQAKVDWVQPSKNPDCQHVFKTENAAPKPDISAGATLLPPSIDDDDLPF